MTVDVDVETLLGGAREIAREAGEAILEVYHGAEDPGVTTKSDDSPLTRADLESHRVIAAGLARLTPEIPVLSEEGADAPYEDRRDWGRFWLVDPLDGTKEFIRRNGEFTVNIALIEGGAPVLGVVHVPVLARTLSGAVGLGAWRHDGDGEPGTIAAAGTGGETLVVAASRSHPGPHLEAFLAALPEHRLLSMGSSLKLCLVAEGQTDLYPRLGPTMEWDTAAAHAVVSAAGGRVLGFDGHPLRYNKEDLHNPFFIVLSKRRVPWREAYAAARST
ncbi:MAG: 3'(2'),5'-bisphosphate nucleotidase CysQ [bacterium]|nr:3'(2'),5'-bisphosphate nucleotidase CysQ [bacterium]